MPYKVPKNIPFCSFVSFLLTPFIKEPDSSKDLTIFIYHSSLHSKLLMWFSLLSPKSEGHAPDPNIFLLIAEFIADADAVNPSCIKTLLSSGLGIFFTNANPVFSNGPRSLPKSPLDSLVLCN